MQKNARGKIIQYWWRWAKSLALKSLNRRTRKWLLIRINCPHFRLIILLPVSQGKNSRSDQETSPKIPQLYYLHKFSYSLLPYFRRTVTEVSSQLLCALASTSSRLLSSVLPTVSSLSCSSSFPCWIIPTSKKICCPFFSL